MAGRQLIAIVLMLCALGAQAQASGYPEPKATEVLLRGFQFHSGETLPELRIRVLTIGDPAKPAILILHGTAGSAASMLVPGFAGQLFGAGQALDASRYFLVLPDALGAGGSTKPSDGLRGHFPHYDYADMVKAQYRAVSEGLGLSHLRLVLGYSMGGMQAWMWAETYPALMDGVVPLASQPTAMSGRNWMLRRLLLETIQRDPAYENGDYRVQPPSLALASAFYVTATSGGTLRYQAEAPNSAKANALVDAMLLAPPPKDANDFLYQWASSEDYDPSPRLEAITAPVLAINSADDERNPPEIGLMAAAMARVKSARLVVIPASVQTRGHATLIGLAQLYAEELKTFLDALPTRQ